MKKQSISSRQAISTVAMFIIGSSLILGISRQSGPDSWIGFLISFAAALPVYYIYSRLMGRYPGKNIFEICELALGKVLGKIACVLLAWFALHLGALVMRNFSEFIQVNTFTDMPQIVSLLSLLLLVVWAARAGVETLGRSASVMLPILLVIVAATLLMLARDMKPANLLPIGENLGQVPVDVLTDFTYPFGEIVLFLGISNTLKDNEPPGRTLAWGAVIGGATILFGAFFRNSLVLGFPLLQDINFTSFHATSIAIAGGFLSRIEATITANFLMAGFVKVTVCLMAASIGFARIIGQDDYRPFAAPMGILMAALAGIVYSSTMQMFAFLDVWRWYALPFEVGIPVVVAVAAEVRCLVRERREKRKMA